MAGGTTRGFAVELRGIEKRYGDNRVLRNVALSLDAGQFHVLVGRNGAGKSTLLRILGRREPPDAGTATTFGRSLDEDLAEHGRDVALVSEATDYAVPLTMREFFSRFEEIRPNWDWTLFVATARSFSIDLDKSFDTLSRGQRMQVVCAATLAAKPRLALLDEVTSVLDARARPYFVDAFVEFCRRGGTVLMATNIVSEVRDAADRLLLLEEGTVQIDIMVKELSDRFVRLVRAAGRDHPIFSSPECVRIGRGDDELPRWLAPRQAVIAASVPDALIDLRKVTPEEAFIYFTTRAG